MGLALGDDRTTSFDFKTEDFTSASSFPWKSEESSQSIFNGFIRETRMTDLTTLFKINILQKLIPGLNKPGYTEDQTTSSTQASSQRYLSPLQTTPNLSLSPPRNIDPPPLFPTNQPNNDPLRLPPRHPIDPEPMPDFEDPYDLTRPPGPLFPQPSGPPLSIGHDDLNPPGLGTPFYYPGAAGIGPTGLPRPGGGHSGMFMDIRGRGRGGTTPPGVPPGARWDPIGPGGRGRGGGGNPFGGYMDYDFV
jgi:PI31 proteasome regulator N-terminal/PI31 proteasome regulator